MQPVKLGNEKALQLTNTLLIREINNKLSSTYNVDIEYKRYHFLDKARAAELRQKEHSFVLNTFGAKYLLFLTHINFKPYAIYVNRKNSTFFLVKTRFSIELYEDTILEGESVKINDRWFFLISDCLVFKKEMMMTNSFKQRYNIISDILENHYVSDQFLEPFSLIKKDFFGYDDLINVKEKYIPTLPFTVNGFLFKCENNASYDILYIFPECRNKKPDNEIIQKDNTPKTVSPKKIEETIENKLVEKNEATFLTKMTEYPDVYELYMFDKIKQRKAKVGFAGVPNIPTSVMMKSFFKNSDEEIYIKYKKHPINDKWIPQYVVPSEN